MNQTKCGMCELAPATECAYDMLLCRPCVLDLDNTSFNLDAWKRVCEDINQPKSPDRDEYHDTKLDIHR